MSRYLVERARWMAGPLSPLTVRDVTHNFEFLLSSGLDIREMNAVRKRFTRWSAGRLALALAPRQLHIWVISDVIGDDLESIASGPCSGDSWTSEATVALLAKRGLLDRLPDDRQSTDPAGDTEARRCFPVLARPPHCGEQLLGGGGSRHRSAARGRGCARHAGAAARRGGRDGGAASQTQ